ncbi:MAG: hypothetical protein HZA84_05790 [Thaumarchaeota archaeon]|nr:hypothetical protein [Nitrososphaerota archaeon]
MNTKGIGIIVCREDEQSKIKEWTEFFNKNGVQIIGIVISKLQGDENVTNNSIITANIVGLSRENVQVTSSIRVFAALLRSKLGI